MGFFNRKNNEEINKISGDQGVEKSSFAGESKRENTEVPQENLKTFRVKKEFVDDVLDELEALNLYYKLYEYDEICDEIDVQDNEFGTAEKIIFFLFDSEEYINSDENGYINDHVEGTDLPVKVVSVEPFKEISESEIIQEIQENEDKNLKKRDEKDLEFELPKEKKERAKKGRTVDLHARFTEAEAEKIRKDREAAGMKPGAYMRYRMLESEQIVAVDHQALEANTRTLSKLKSEIGMVGGLLKSMIKPIEASTYFSEAEAKEVKYAVNEIERLKVLIQKEVNRRWRF